MRQAYLGDIQFPTGARVLEVGCGTGAVTRELASWPGVAEVVGLDPLPHLPGQCPPAPPAHQGGVRGGDAQTLQFPDRSFDVVVFHTALKAEARRRSAAGQFFGHIAYASLVARLPDQGAA